MGKQNEITYTVLEIDNILKESERKFQKGEIRCSPLIELENRLRKKRQALWDEINLKR